MNAQQAIERSVRHNEIVTIDHDQADWDSLLAASDDMAQHAGPDGVAEFWGTTDSGSEWRVHMRASKRGEG